MELAAFKTKLMEVIEDLNDYLTEIKYELFAPQPEEAMESVTTYDAENFEDFYRKACLELGKASIQAEKIYKFIVDSDYETDMLERPAPQSELFNCLENFKDDFNFINDWLSKVYETLTGLGEETKALELQSTSVAGYADYILARAKDTLTWANKILNFITKAAQEVSIYLKKSDTVIEPLTDKLDYCD